MAKAKVLDDKVVIKSEVLTDENLRKVSMLQPATLRLTDAESKEVLYEVAQGRCNSFTKYGALFINGETKSNITIDAEDAEEVKEILRDVIAANLIRINAIERQVEEFIEKQIDDNVDGDIEFLG